MATTEVATTDALPTTGEPGCPAQPSGTLLWSTVMELEEDDLFVPNTLAAVSDGRIAFGGTRFSEDWHDGLLWFGEDGTQQGWTLATKPIKWGLVHANLRVLPDDSLLFMLENHDGDPVEDAWPNLVHFAPDGAELARVDIDDGRIADAYDFELLGDRVVLSGVEETPAALLVAMADLATGAVIWETELIASAMKNRVAVGPGGEIVVGDGRRGPDGYFKVWRLDPASGAVAWEADLMFPEPDAELADLVATPDGRAIAVAFRKNEDHTDGSLVAAALALDSGAEQWRTEVAVTTDDGLPFLNRVLVDGDALTLPVTRDAIFVDGPPIVEVSRLSFTGALLGTSTLPIPADQIGSFTHVPARGRCGELLLFQDGMDWRLMAFAP
ncbi:outer membrane protein assembly factor BamB family protein [Nannocystis radixulma]|uniref:PQQ-binding-like beta-propeller repeat protein n=1 Tax=Nannocystis radixulma TaxID=2995305 RepID=A0ABT5B7U0_9BACT|nr:PQQ-binding-like beta-propeller repeat protein [Nannocystis radixulma]MDC0670186.1 PQQ-binding-like beta-propeller repeat protein [Nannocystis radixulma]